jgi:hypothetical protein
MSHTNTAIRVAGTWLAIASFLLVVALIIHGPLAPDISDQMKRIADGAMRWSVIPQGVGRLLIPVCGDRASRADLRITAGRRLVDHDGVGGVDRERPLDHDNCRS